jgi:outer membrane protein
MQPRRDQGIARKTEVLLIETQVASDEAQHTRARLSLDIARTQLAFLLGRPVEVPLADELPAHPVPPELPPLIQEALALRSDLREREAALRAAEEAVRVVAGEHWPSLDLTANYYAYREGSSSTTEKINWDVLVALNWTLFRGGDVRAREFEALSQLRSTRLFMDELRRQIEADVTNALASLRADDSLIRTLEGRERTARENFEQIVTEYRQGIAGVTNLEVLVAQNQFLSAQLELDRQRIQRCLDWYLLQVVLGKIPVRLP